MGQLDLFKPALRGGRPGVASYRELIQVFLDAGMTGRPHREGFPADASSDASLFLRHDVDRVLDTAVLMARIDADLGVRSSFYLLHPGDYDSLENYYGAVVDGRVVHSAHLQDAAAEIAVLGHEIGLHNDFIQLSRKTGRPPAELIAEEIAWFAGLGITISGTASHGSGFARQHGYLNYELFAEAARLGKQPRTITFDDGGTFDLQSMSCRDVGLEYEAYGIGRDCYVSDSGGRFAIHGEKPDPVIMSKVRPMIAGKDRAVVLIHPEWWNERKPLTRTASAGPRRAALPVVDSEPVFRRPDGAPVRVGVRGDCCCRRMVHLNRAMFPDGYDMLVNEKCTNAAYVDTLRGRTATDDELLAISDTDAMSTSLRTYYLGQNDRSVLEMRDLDLLVMDTYSDMNFELWALPGSGSKVWVHPKMLRAGQAQSLVKIGRATLEDAVADAVAVIDAVREHNPGVPVLFLSQPVAYYSKLSGRRGFDRMGSLVAQERFGVYHCDPLDFSQLEPDDMDSSGPGQTLHFTGETYRRMVRHAWQRGLADHFDGTSRARDEVAAAGTARPVPLTARQRLARTAAATVAVRQAKRARRRLGGAKRRAGRFAARATAPGAPGRMVRKVGRRLRPRPAPSPRPAPVAPPAPAVVPVALPETVPTVTIGFGLGLPGCVPACSDKVSRGHQTYREYFTLPEDDPEARKRYTPMLIPTDDIVYVEAWEQHIKTFGKGSRLRQKRKAERVGYTVHEFAWAQHVPDIHAINHSKEIRSGGEMRGSYRFSIEEMGGAPTSPSSPVPPACKHHWDLRFGTFLPEPGHTQGDVVVDERLVAYIALSRNGDVVLYSMILGHADHLADGALVLLHHEVIRWLSSERDGLAQDLRYVMYGGWENGGPSLLQWKRQAGFTPHHVIAVDSDAEVDLTGALLAEESG